MIRNVVIIVLVIIALALLHRPDDAAHSLQTQGNTDDDVVTQLKDLHDQIAALKANFNTQAPRMVMAGTATWTRPEILENRTSVRVSLAPAIARQLGKDYVVLLTNRFPKDGYPYLASYWIPADNGFDIRLVEPTLPNGGKVSYASANRTYLVDWIVVKKPGND